MQPMLAPILHSVKLRYYSFFIPYRILDDNWEEFITMGEEGQSVVALPLFKPSDFTASVANVTATGSLWDYLGYNPVDVASDIADDVLPIDYPRLAYIRIWNEFFGCQVSRMRGHTGVVWLARFISCCTATGLVITTLVPCHFSREGCPLLCQFWVDFC